MYVYVHSAGTKAKLSIYLSMYVNFVYDVCTIVCTCMCTQYITTEPVPLNTCRKIVYMYVHMYIHKYVVVCRVLYTTDVQHVESTINNTGYMYCTYRQRE